MTDEEILLYIKEKFKDCRNLVRSVKEVFPKEINENNEFENTLYNMMEDYVKNNAKKIKKK
jgi:hypothetical protein